MSHAESPRSKAGPESDRTAARSLEELLSEADLVPPRSLGRLIDRLQAEGRLVSVESGEPSGAVRSLQIRSVELDSRRVEPGALFVAVPGEHVDGHEFVASAAARGAAAAIVEHFVPGLPLPQIVVDRSPAALAVAAAWRFDDPSRELGVVGVTGTDGKTTTSFLATAVLEAAGISTGLITTAEMKIGAVTAANPEHVTTPQAPSLQKALRAMVMAGNRAAVVETTSHGLALDRVAGIAYDVAIFTNLTHEHLELHGTFEAYREAKVSLFSRLGHGGAKRLEPEWPATAIVNADDPAAAFFEAGAAAAGARLLRYGLAPAADVRASDIREVAGRPAFEVRTPRWQGEIGLRLIGRFNVHNALAAIALGEALELEPAAIRSAVAGLPGVPGRMERLECGQPFDVIVDYAHSPASLTIVLDQLAPVAAAGGGGLIVVFGSAGERDVRKRPMMGRVAGERCRLVVVADEDPRGEDPEEILVEIAAGAEEAGKTRGKDLLLIADRRAAIEAAMTRARPGDVVLLAGKGHEQSIIYADGPHPWDERTEAIEALRRLGFEAGYSVANPVERA